MSKTARAPGPPRTSLYLTGTKAFDRSHSSLDAVVGSNKNVANPSALLLNGWAMLTWFLRMKGNSMATWKRQPSLPEHRLRVLRCGLATADKRLVALKRTRSRKPSAKSSPIVHSVILTVLRVHFHGSCVNYWCHGPRPCSCAGLGGYHWELSTTSCQWSAPCCLRYSMNGLGRRKRWLPNFLPCCWLFGERSGCHPQGDLDPPHQEALWWNHSAPFMLQLLASAHLPGIVALIVTVQCNGDWWKEQA